jgi:glycosyltransferase involved in cell wall biosynthesis
MTKADGVRANSNAIVNEVEQRYEIQFPERVVKLVPHGMAPALKKLVKRPNSEIVILFVGRLELRKGIDVFLQAIPKVLETIPEARVKIIGDYSLLGPHGSTFMDNFKSEHANKDWLGKVLFEGRVDQDVLLSAYETCDIFVAPSRFESFGLIFLEAMREGKPVIGCNAGGMPEVVSHGVNGLLVEPGDTQQLTDAILQLATNLDLRQKMGEAGKRIFNEKFTANRMAEESAALYDLAKVNYSILK